MDNRDKEKLKQQWKKLEKQHQDLGNTFKSNTIPPQKKSSLPQVTFSQQEIDDLFFTEQRIEEQNTIIDPSASSYTSEAKPSSVNYDVGEEIARGGMGIIYKAKQISLQRDIAIKKLIDNENIPNLREKFINEAVVTAFLDHPNIVPVHELGKSVDGEIILAMKLVGGTSWNNVMSNPQYDLDYHLGILLNVCNAVAFAHSKKIIHNDLKPENIMIGEFGEVLVMDWGIALDINDVPDTHKKTLSGRTLDSPMGTPHYMPLELAQGNGANIGAWTDVYLLGGILYEILTGNPPHSGSNIWEVISCVIDGASLEFTESTPIELQQICTKALSRNSEERYQSVHEFKKAIKDFIKHRESNTISNKACEILKTCEEKVLKVTSAQLILQKIERSQLYDQFAQSIARFQQSIELWKGNSIAAESMQNARLLYAKVALHNSDTGLAEAQISKIVYNTEEVKQLRRKINQQKISKIRQTKTTRKLRTSLTAASIFIILGLATSTILIRKEHLRAQQKATEAIELQEQKANDANKSRIKLAKIALSKAIEARKRTEWNKLGSYAAEALEFIKNIESGSEQIQNIKNTTRNLIAIAEQKKPLLWRSPSRQNLSSGKITAISAHKDHIVYAVNQRCYVCDTTGKIIVYLPESAYKIQHVSIKRNLVAIGLKNKVIKIFNLQTAKTTHTFSHHSTNSFFNFSSHSNALVYNTNESVNIWNLDTNAHQILYYHTNIHSLAVSETTIASASNANITTYNLATQQTVNIPKNRKVTLISLHKNLLLSVLDKQTINLRSANTIVHSLHNKNAQINATAINDRWLVAAFANRSLVLWSTQTGKQVYTTQLEMDIESIEFFTDTQILIITKDRQVQTWDCKTRNPSIIFPGHKSRINAIKFSKNGKTIATVSNDHTLKLWLTSTGKLHKTLRGHNAAINCLDFSTTSNLIITGSENKDSTSKLWNISQNTQQTIFKHNNLDIYSVAFSEDDKLVAVGSAENVAMLWQLSKKATFNNFRHPTTVKQLLFTGSQLVTVCQGNDNKIRWWDTKEYQRDPKPLFEIQIPNKVTNTAVCKRNKTLATVVDNNTIYLWDVTTRTLLHKFGPYSYTISTLSISPTMMALFTSQSTIEILSLKTGRSITTIPAKENINCIAISPVDQLIAIASDEQIQLLSIPAQMNYSKPGKSIFIDSQKKYIASVIEQKIFIYDSSSLKNLGEKKIDGSVVDFLPMKNAIFFNNEKQVFVWDLEKDKEYSTKIFGKLITCSPSGNNVAIMSFGDTHIFFHDIKTNKDHGQIQRHLSKKVHMQFVSENIVAIALDNKLLLHDIAISDNVEKLFNNEKVKTFPSNIQYLKVFANNIFLVTEKQIFIVDNTLRTTQIIDSKHEIGHLSCDSQHIVFSNASGTIYVWNRTSKQFTHIFNNDHEKVDDMKLLNENTLIISANNQITHWTISPIKKMHYSTKWQNTLENNFSIDTKTKNWTLNINLDFSAKITAENLFGKHIEDNLSTKNTTPVQYFFK
ncbi:WD40 repeat domain-containing serine/threonine-protein kinase [Candidatus Uabimicrobium sp. HlEnr_7]|uniref:WD40 repeat domain-containing serine/threonine-protein kinase n=1 Tax=Candidatus Uabimicrobium helgolandensis TaxID=3095367 RepID=UPI003558720C